MTADLIFENSPNVSKFAVYIALLIAPLTPGISVAVALLSCGILFGDYRSKTAVMKWT